MTRVTVLSLLVLPLVAACGGEPAAPPPPATGAWLLAADVADAVPVLDAVAREDGAEVAVVGRVREVSKGVFTLVDDSIDFCGRGADTMEQCKTPWDYCCKDKDMVAAATLVVKALDASGAAVPKESLGVRPLDLVAVKGKLGRNAAGAPVLVGATGWFRRERPPVAPDVHFD